MSCSVINDILRRIKAMERGAKETFFFLSPRVLKIRSWPSPIFKNGSVYISIAPLANKNHANLRSNAMICLIRLTDHYRKMIISENNPPKMKPCYLFSCVFFMNMIASSNIFRSKFRKYLQNFCAHFIAACFFY